MPRNKNIKKVLLIGSGPIVIGQAAEFDYSGTQAIESLKEEGIEVILINSNPATIMTDRELADRVYLEPLTSDFIQKIIYKERPDALLATLGGQTALNLALELSKSGLLTKMGVELLGVNLTTIEKAEDREHFRKLMEEMKIPTPESQTVETLSEAKEFLNSFGLPLIIRPAFTLGGSGGGIAKTQEDFESLVLSGLRHSPINQILIEKSIEGLKEIEYEVIRDARDNCIIVCNMENLDPVGIHTGDSIVVAPSQTLTNREVQILRDVSIKIVRELKIEGGCNVQLALNPRDSSYYVIEVNPRVSRSSALASKATGYPIAKVSTKIALGLCLDEILNPITKNTYACFEPALDYIVVKIPRFPFDKFPGANKTLGTQMSATGEVMAIGRNFEQAFLKAIRSLEIGRHHVEFSESSNKKIPLTVEDCLTHILKQDDERIFYLASALRLGISVDKLAKLTSIDLWFLHKIEHIIKLEKQTKEYNAIQNLERSHLKELKLYGFSDKKIAQLLLTDESEVKNLRNKYGIHPSFNLVDTCAAEFVSKTPYYYSTYECHKFSPAHASTLTTSQTSKLEDQKKSIIILGSGPIRIGQGIEFDYSTVHATKVLKELGYKSIVINNNPETVSTDFSIADKLYFEPLYIEEVMEIIRLERPYGVIVQFGGQTAINLTEKLSKEGVRVLGTSKESIDIAEDRSRFERLLNSLDIARPLGTSVTSLEEAREKAKSLEYPLMLRPHYVIGGESMQIVYNEQQLEGYFQTATHSSILIDKYIIGTEAEIDAVSDGENVFIPGIIEHIERSGVHSGDSFAVHPPQTLSQNAQEKMLLITEKIAKALKIKGLLNIQFVIKNDHVYVIEVNPRSSRTLPFLSKVTHCNLSEIALKAILGQKISNHSSLLDLEKKSSFISIKAPVFSFAKIKEVDPALGPEMKSTGEAMGRDHSFQKALRKAFIAAGMNLPDKGTILVTLADKHKEETLPLLQNFHTNGFHFVATKGTAQFLQKNNLPVKEVSKIESPGRNLLDEINAGNVDLIINTLTKGKNVESDGFKMRCLAAEKGVICLTSLDTAKAIYEAINMKSLKVIDL